MCLNPSSPYVTWYANSMQIEIWLDVVCPWCWIGKRRFEAAMKRFEHADRTQVILRSFELDPHAPSTSEGTVAQYLADKYGVDLERAKAMNADVTDLAADEGLSYRLDVAKRGNTFDAHRLIHLAREHDMQDDMAERIMRAYFTEGEQIGDPETLLRLSEEVGVPAAAARDVLQGDGYAEAVRDDERMAARLGIQGVPCIVFDRRTAVTGAQPAEVVLRALQEAHATREASAARR